MKKNTKEVLISEKLEDRSNKLSDGLTKIKPMYIGCESLSDVASTIDVINEESPEIRARIMKRLRDYKFTGEGIADNSFQPKQLPKLEINVDED